jgi:sterol desaturase/sphingolipid hydroxylase (fatty acid hydroxylase superfamily)
MTPPVRPRRVGAGRLQGSRPQDSRPQDSRPQGSGPQGRRLHGIGADIDAGHDGYRPVPLDQPQPGASLGEIARFFLAQTSPRVIVALFVGAVAARLVIGAWGWWDLAIPLIVLGLQPFVEWLVHVRILHRRPSRLGRFTIDPVLARKHREHHRNPKDLRLVMVPAEALGPGVPLGIAAAVWLLDPPQAAMVLSAAFGALLWYEWFHYLIHSPYRARSAWFRRLSRNHILHHYKNEHFWFGVTTSFGDRVLGTRPGEATVEPSPTVRTLGVDPREAAA